MAASAGAAIVLFSASASAEPAVDFDVMYRADVMSAVSGAPSDISTLDDLHLTADIDLARAFGWRGAKAFVHVLRNAGDAPNDEAGTLQGVDNIEVALPRTRLYEAWIEQRVGEGSVRAGLYDLNSEFYVTDASGLLIAPAFGIGSELAATGPNGPSIFPSTALALRGEIPFGEHTKLRAAVINATAGVLGDPGGVDLSFDGGALVIAELAADGDIALSVGGWTYTQLQDDIRDPARQRRAAGIYATAQHELWSGGADAPAASGFVRVGISDGDTTSYLGGWQAGVLIERIVPGRDESQLSLGAYQGRFNSKQRANLRDDGADAASAETGLELTYSDQLTPWLAVQPDLQLVLDPAGDRDRANVWIAGLRLTITPLAAHDATGT